jgi:two-component system LytT family response regulator
MSLEVLIVDDEPPARRRLLALLSALPDVTVVGEARDGLEAVEAIQRLKPGLVLLDVRMPGLTGFEVIHSVGVDVMPRVIFVTAHDEFAADAFDVEAIDFLVKPVDEARFRRAIERAKRDTKQSAPGFGRLLASVLPPGQQRFERLIVKEGERLVFVALADVERLSAAGNYVEVFTATGRHLVRDTLSHLESRLDPARFVRVHRSELVAVDAIAEVQKVGHGDCVVVLRSGAGVRVSRRYAGNLPG